MTPELQATLLEGTFEPLLRSAAEAAASEWGYPPPAADFYAVCALRIPEDIAAEISRGVEEGRVALQGYRFTLPDLERGKGPYALFSRNRGHGVPSPNWEYFVQLAEYLRILRTASHGLDVGFEDGLMDVSVRHEGRLVWYIEAKEKAIQAQRLIDSLSTHAAGVDATTPDRGNDPLRKAKYLVARRPDFFSLIAIGFRRDYAVQYPGETSFQLVPLKEAPTIMEGTDG